MTRCKAFYRKVKELEDMEEVMKFCGKKDNAVYKIRAHIEYMDKHFPDWDNEECTIVQIPEGATRILRHLERKDKKVHDAVLEEVSKLEKPSTKREISGIIREQRIGNRTTDKRITLAHLGAANTVIESIQNDTELMGQLRKHIDAPTLKTLKHLKIGQDCKITYPEPEKEDSITSYSIGSEVRGLKQWLYNFTEKGKKEFFAREHYKEHSSITGRRQILKYNWANLYGVLDNLDDLYTLQRDRYSERANVFYEKKFSIEEFAEELEIIKQESIAAYRNLSLQLQELEAIEEES